MGKEVPWGKFGDTDAGADIVTSNMFIQHGIRMSLALGYLYIDPQYVRNSLDKYWREYKGSSFLYNALDYMNSSLTNDYLVQEIRLCSMRPRINNTFYNVSNLYLSEPERVKDVRQACYYLWQESKQFPKRFAQIMEYCEQSHPSQIQEQLLNIAQKKPAIDSMVKDFFISTIGDTIQKLHTFSKTNDAIVRKYLLQYKTGKNAASKDVDFLLSVYDQEEHEIQSDINTSDLLINWGINVLMDYFDILNASNILSTGVNTQLLSHRLTPFVM